MASYKDMLDSAFSTYYDRFRECRAVNQEDAVTLDELFPDGETITDRQRMQKLLSMGIVKRVGVNRYWLDEKKAADGNGILKQRILLLVIAVIIGVAFGILKRQGIL